VSDAHHATAVSGFADSEVLKGRPYGGCAIFWARNLAARADIIKTDSNRVCALNVDDNTVVVICYLLLCICHLSCLKLIMMSSVACWPKSCTLLNSSQTHI